MIVDRAWAERNIGFDPAKTTMPAGAYVHRRLAAHDADPGDLQREIIDFDSEGPEGATFLAFTKSTAPQPVHRYPLACRTRTGDRPEARQRRPVRCRRPMFWSSRGRRTRAMH